MYSVVDRPGCSENESCNVVLYLLEFRKKILRIGCDCIGKCYVRTLPWNRVNLSGIVQYGFLLHQKYVITFMCTWLVNVIIITLLLAISHT